MPIIKRLKSWMILHEKKLLLSGVFLTLIVQGLTSSCESKESSLEPRQDFSIDTVIPAGHSLFPLELVNQEAISSVLGPYGVIDLYQVLATNQKKLIAENLRIFRAPKNPEEFYVIIPDHQAPEFMKMNQKTLAIIKNRKNGVSHIKKTIHKNRRTITIGEDV